MNTARRIGVFVISIMKMSCNDRIYTEHINFILRMSKIGYLHENERFLGVLSPPLCISWTLFYRIW